MFNSTVLETIIGLAFVYLVFSLVCSVLTEFVARLLNLRGATLKQAIRQLVYGVFTGPTWWGFERKSKTTAGANASSTTAKTVDDFYDHGLIMPLFTTAYNWWRRSPSYMDSRTFALVLVDKILDYKDTTTTQGTEASTATQAQGDTKKDTAKEAPLTTIQDIVNALPQDSPVTERLQHVLKYRELPSTEELDLQMHNQFMLLENAVATLETATTVSPELKQLQSALKPLLVAAKAQSASWEEAYDNTLAGIEKWFNASMERVSGWYGRKARAVTFVFALLITLAFNVDSLAIARSLYTNTTQRQALVAAATTYVGNAQPATNQDGQPAQGDSSIPEQTLDELLTQVEGLGVPIGWVVPDGSKCTGLNTVLCTPLIMRVLDTTAAPEDTGGGSAIEPSQFYPIAANDLPDKAAGLVLTVLMLSLGAPFWFDMLNKLVNLRASGAKPEPADKKS